MTLSHLSEIDTLPVVIETRGGFDLSGSTFTGDVRVEDPETGRTKWIAGEHSQLDYNWGGFWQP